MHNRRVRTAGKRTVLFAAIAFLLTLPVILFSCTEGANITEADRVLSSFSISWPAGFDFTCLSGEPVEITVAAYDQNGAAFAWSGTVTIEVTNASVSVSPSSVNLSGGTVTRSISFVNSSEEDQVTGITLSSGNVVTDLSVSLNVSPEEAIKPAAFSLEWPSGFDNTCLSQESLEVTVNALDDSGTILDWDGTVDIVLTNQNITVSPVSLNLENGTITRDISFINATNDDQVTGMTMSYLDVVTVLDSTIVVSHISAIQPVGFDLAWPGGFDYGCSSGESVEVTVTALDSAGDTLVWSGSISVELSNPNVEVSPPTMSLTSGTLTREIVFTNDTEENQETDISLVMSDVVQDFDYTLTVYETDAPATADGLTAEPWNGLVKLTWDNPTDTDLAGVCVVRSGDDFPSSVSDGVTVYDGLDGVYTDMELTNGKTYYYSFFAYDEEGNLSGPRSVDATPDGHEVEATFRPEDGTVTVYWHEDPDAECYHIYYTSDGTEPGVDNGIHREIAAGTTEYPFTGLSNFAEYKFAVKAVKFDTESENAGILRVVPPGNIAGAGVYFTAAVTRSGSAWCWGHNNDGMLGDGSYVDSDVPVQVLGEGGSGTLGGVIAIDGGTNHAVALLDTGTVKTWGDGYVGQLGHGSLGTGVRVNTPVTVVSETCTGSLSNIVGVAAGDYHCVALKEDGTMWSWGSNGSGQLGDGMGSNSACPVQVRGEGGAGYLSGIVQVSANGNYSLALGMDGTVWGWGSNGSGQIGDGTDSNKYTPAHVTTDGSTPLQNVVYVSAGSLHGVAVLDDGTVWTWGNNGNGELGDGGASGSRSLTAVQVLGVGGSGVLSGIRTVSGGGRHTLAVTDSGSLLAWGGNDYDELGTGEEGGSNVPVSVQGLNSTGTFSGVRAVTAGGKSGVGGGHSIGVRSDGVWGWGRNTVGQLGIGSETQVDYPNPVTRFAHITAIDSGSQFTLALDQDGYVWSWGYNYYGQLGDGTETNRSTPVRVKGEGGSGYLSGITAIAAGGSHALAANGTNAWGWGRNSVGQLGQNNTTNSSTPVRVTTDGTNPLANVAGVAAGSDHSLFLISGGTVMSCGGNAYGQLGNNTGGPTTDSMLPVTVVGTSGTGTLTGISSVDAGASLSIALADSGAVYAWGYNGQGQLGIGGGGEDRRYYPGNVKTGSSTNLSGISSIACGYFHGLARTSGGSVWAWGQNEHGQIGNGSSGDGLYSWYAEQVFNEDGSAPLSGIGSVGAGYEHSLAVSSGGSAAWAWGKNWDGEIGNDLGATYQNEERPVKVHGENGNGYLTGVSRLTGGTNMNYPHSAALKSDGSVRSWGANQYGTMGDGSTLGRENVPVITAPFDPGW